MTTTTHTAHPSTADSVLKISVGHHVSGAGAEYVREKIGPALAHAPEPILSARVRLTGHRDHAVPKPIVAQANINMEGRPVRVQVSAATTREAVDLLAARLKARFERLSRHWEAVRGGGRGEVRPHEWHHGEPPRERLPYYPRPIEERQVLRRKSYALADVTIDEAAFDMDLMDYGFELFTESGSGVDSVLYRRGNGDYRLAQLSPNPEAITPGAVRLTVSPLGAPVLDVEGAITRLEMTKWPFVFFREGEQGRGRVLYHRYDGHYGLITPAT
ncbi:HPF/RaiA family ribosome-associated protein [Nocardia sp. ET3-3]|uniref:HPF/RaiA family ribosome-associated protein n=1 Tax=Nocardia terrae TaxID=2675851 RepID=A0A7K1UVU6_9NOCA|nr:sigma 54 modulation/S30EA ribosomal C-terminal domain-containing protein [Nocardia terrae]MVU78455.1 HPF/RaiA family ribosome-associated protein [Nocardia terrae]